MTLLTLAIAAYLLVGLGLCIKGKLATKVAYSTAIVASYGSVPVWKVSVYRWALRAGVVVGWPVFLFNK